MIKKEEPTKTPEVERTRSSRFTTIYTDDTGMTMNPAGIKLFFGNITEANEGKVFVEQDVCVCMSAEHAYNLHEMLERQLDKFQKTFGAIRTIPKGVLNAASADASKIKE